MAEDGIRIENPTRPIQGEYQPLKADIKTEKDNLVTIETLSKNEKAVVQMDNFQPYLVVDLPITHNPDNPDQYIKTENPSRYFFHPKYGAIEIASINEKPLSSEVIDVKSIIGTLSRNPKTKIPENSNQGFCLKSQVLDIYADENRPLLTALAKKWKESPATNTPTPTNESVSTVTNESNPTPPIKTQNQWTEGLPRFEKQPKSTPIEAPEEDYELRLLRAKQILQEQRERLSTPKTPIITNAETNQDQTNPKDDLTEKDFLTTEEPAKLTPQPENDIIPEDTKLLPLEENGLTNNPKEDINIDLTPSKDEVATQKSKKRNPHLAKTNFLLGLYGEDNDVDKSPKVKEKKPNPFQNFFKLFNEPQFSRKEDETLVLEESDFVDQPEILPEPKNSVPLVDAENETKKLDQKTEYYYDRVDGCLATNYGKDGYINKETSSFNDYLDQILNTPDIRNHFNDLRYLLEGQKTNTTNVLFVPGQKNTLIATAPYAYGVDKRGNSLRSGYFDFGLIMNNADALQFQKDIQENPRLLLSLIRKVNNGPITDSNGNPAEILPGEKVRILANDTVGGNINKPIDSASFPPNYNSDL